MSNADKYKKVAAGNISKFLNNSATTPATSDTTDTAVPTVAASTVATTRENTLNLARSKPIRLSREERTTRNLEAALETYSLAKNGSIQKINALADIFKIVKKNPTNTNLETVYKFFVSHKNDEFIDPSHALQRITTLDKVLNLQVRLFWSVMYRLAQGTATRKRISLELLRTVLKSEDLVNWIAYKMNTLSRASKK